MIEKLLSNKEKFNKGAIVGRSCFFFEHFKITFIQLLYTKYCTNLITDLKHHQMTKLSNTLKDIQMI